MEPLQLPEGDVVATHPATLTGRILAVLMLMLPGGALIWAATQAQGTRADARIPLIAAGVTPVGTTIYITLTDPHGKKHRVPSNMKAMDILAERIADQQTAVRFSEARAIIDRGERSEEH